MMVSCCSRCTRLEHCIITNGNQAGSCPYKINKKEKRFCRLATHKTLKACKFNPEGGELLPG